MKCEDLQLNLPLYSDGILTSDEYGALDEHLAKCPLCRQRLEELRSIRHDLHSLSRPEIPASVLASIQAAVASETGSFGNSPAFTLIEGHGRWIDAWLLPSGIGAFASVLIGITFLWILLSSVNRPGDPWAPTVYGSSSPSSLLIANGDPGRDPDIRNYAETRLAFANESPSVNPKGALIALTKSLVRGEMRDDEVVVVADVFGNGLAKIAEVVEPSRDRRAVGELEKALESDPAYSPFVPAVLDQRGDPIRVVLRIQSVDVSTRQRRRPRKRKPASHSL